MGNPFQKCKVCSAPPEVLAAVNDALLKREKLRDIAARTGFSRAGLWRHSQKCIPRATLAQFKARSLAPSGRSVVSWPARPDQPAHYTLLFTEDVLHESDLLPTDCIFRVKYSPNFSVELDRESRRTRISNKILDEALAENELRTSQNDS